MQKREAEDVLADAFHNVSFPVTRLRLPMVNGERDHHRRIESYLWRLLDGGPVLLPDGGENQLRHVYSGDVVKAIVRLLGDATTFGQAYNLSQDEMPTLAELVALLAHLLGSPVRLVAVSTQRLQEAGLEPAHISPFSERWMSRLDATRAKTELSFQPEPLRSYLDKIVTCFLNHPPSTPLDNYALRKTELELAASLPPSATAPS
jgi:nucleoside-diphosphate-sugar epimerase